MKVSIFGLGYVGAVSAACLVQDSHQVMGVDVNSFKVQQIQAGLSPIIEPGLDELVAQGVQSGRLQATENAGRAVLNSDVSLICVGTPSNGNGSLHMRYLENVCAEIGRALAEKAEYHVVVVRSTVLPGTVNGLLRPIIEQQSGGHAGADFGLVMNPEFLREGSSIHDYYHPSFIVVGELDERSGDAVQRLYQAVEAPVIRTGIETAEMLKYVSNAFHALKITFANEVGNLAKAHGVDGREVMDIFARDTQLNIAPTYLRPGYAFGGSCLPKDLRALLYRAKERDLALPVLAAVLESNAKQIQRAIQMVERVGRERVGILGLSFKAGTDDVRESPVVPLIETLIGRGYQVAVYDEVVKPDMLVGANKRYLERELPHIASIMCDSMEALLHSSDVVVLTNDSRAFREAPRLLRPEQTLIDLVGTAKNSEGFDYDGICW